jgi:hypothetical protein
MGHQSSSHLSYSVRASVGGCRWGIDVIGQAGQEPLGPWWCKRSESELERLASRVPKYSTSHCTACP